VENVDNKIHRKKHNYQFKSRNLRIKLQVHQHLKRFIDGTFEKQHKPAHTVSNVCGVIA
jgi:hypothetical protein